MDQDKNARNTQVNPMTNKANILVIDDEEVVRLSHLRTLASEHCNVVTAWNGEHALQIMDQKSFDVVLLDLRMPGMDGMTVLKAIKEKWPEAEVIVITGYPAVETAKEAVRLGAYDFLAKPVDPDDVIHAAFGAVQHKRWAMRTEAPAHGTAIH
jgi:DNA-binding NtrC family response regulator